MHAFATTKTFGLHMTISTEGNGCEFDLNFLEHTPSML